jgi:hypothetical protein
LLAPVASLLGLGGAALQVFFESARPYLLAFMALSLGYSFYVVYRRPFRPRPLVIRLWITTIVAVILAAVPFFRD